MFMDWTAEWIRFGWGEAVPLLRKSFKVEKKVKRAELSGTALGVCELRLNGEKVGDTHLLPGWTDYRKRVYYHTFDVTDRVLPGENVLGGMPAAGWFASYFAPFGDKGYYGHEAWISSMLQIEYEDGSKETFSTDSSWKGTPGPISKADLLMGETYDARVEIDGWDAPGFDDSGWHSSILITPEERLPERIEPFPGTPVRTISELPIQSLSEPKPGMYVADLGQNMVGVVRLKVEVPAGTEIVLKHGEMLNLDGTLYTENLRSAKATDRYIAKGGGIEVWQPRFTFHGFRYVEIHGLPHPPKMDVVTGLVWMSELRETARFECSDEKVNRLFQNILWGFRGNYLEVPTDCPQRDERMGWTGDTQMFIRSASYLADIRPFYEKWMVDLHDAQHPDGGYPDVAPWMGRFGYASAAWSDAGIICPHVLWQAYGETEVIQTWWPQMKKFMELICTDVNRHNGPEAEPYGDWLHIQAETPTRLIGLAYRAYDARLMAEMAVAIGETTDAECFSVEAEKSRALFREQFFCDGAVAVRTQTAAALAIVMELLSGDDLGKAEESLVQCMEERDGYLSTGFVGTGYLCPALTKMGRSDLAVQLLLNEGYPSWLHEVNNGATTIWERWDSWTAKGGFGDVGMNSFNHYAFGSVFEWMFESLLGIKPGAPGFLSVEIMPSFTDRFDFVKGSFDSIQGRIAVEWKRTESGFELQIDTPVPTHVRLPLLTETVAPGHHVFSVVSDAE